MNFDAIRRRKRAASQRLENAPLERKITLIYAGITAGSSLLVMAVNYLLGLQISQLGGLGSMGLRSILGTVQTVLPMVQMLMLMCLDLGYRGAMLRISRGQYTSPQTLRSGIQRFGVMLRCSLLEGFLYVGLVLLGTYVAVQISLFSPMMEQIAALVADTQITDAAALMTHPAYPQIVEAMQPVFALCAILSAALILPFFYRLRMVDYVLLDQPGQRARMVMGLSALMMRGKALSLFKVDLSLWWYHGLMLLATAVCYGDSLLRMVGITLPWSAEVSYLVFYGLYLVMQFAVTCLLRSRVEVVYAMTYDAFRPRQPEQGAALGSIFHTDSQ